ncbi:hypothetical protein N5P37_010129 [Trichoderma harzianum]|uniref:Uncharacterized protein n=1 Tax=Trichoderma harzianum CBS 226.95 TaxID=983964 RepID=A0A2T4A518_TRIHA|nr:hypothetical protein M431DRAFT_510364 [Trichoderma harzianum CBS 226.95]KAK0757406.1 hypothetical protein N5P37_010129 [Trichoderma harzianum]PKK46935.1 hypothetical protein CI102_9009 [Trichoderma harzianum]PTB52167.1 hypothetical protein M431DRAFT_510364 [Trichoderma harzianum CBS 226.95]
MGRLAVLPVFFAITLIISLAFGKNVAPRTLHTPKGITNKASAVNVRGHKDTEQKLSNDVLPEHIFYGNYQVNFSWNNKQLQAALGIRPLPSLDKRNIVKRTPGSQPGDPVFKLPSCLGCIEAAAGKVTSINDLTTEWLEKQILLPDSQLMNRCVFYTSVPKENEDKAEWDLRQTMGHLDHPGLSWFATDWACNHKLLSIWNLYSGKNDISNPNPDNPKDRNYWEVFVDGSWLAFLQTNQVYFTYFEHMSRAMARHCGGVVYVMSLKPRQLSKYQYIWAAEFSELKARYSGASAGRPTQLVAVNAIDNTEQWNISWDDLSADSTPLSKGDPGHIDFVRLSLERRANCQANLDYEVNMDWFG